MFQVQSKPPKLDMVPYHPHRQLNADRTRFRLSERHRPKRSVIKSAPAVFQRKQVAAAAVEDVTKAVHCAEEVAMVMS